MGITAWRCYKINFYLPLTGWLLSIYGESFTMQSILLKNSPDEGHIFGRNEICF